MKVSGFLWFKEDIIHYLNILTVKQLLSSAKHNFRILFLICFYQLAFVSKKI